MAPMHLSSFKTPNANIKCAISTIQMHTKYLFGFKLIWRLRFVFCDFLFFIYYLFFYFYHVFQLFQETKITVYVLFITVHAFFNALFTGHTIPLFKKKILKMGHTVLFTHLQIILLQYFQFSFLVKINCTKMKSKIFGGHVSYLGPYVTQPGTRCMFGGHTHFENSINRKVQF